MVFYFVMNLIINNRLQYMLRNTIIYDHFNIYEEFKSYFYHFCF